MTLENFQSDCYACSWLLLDNGSNYEFYLYANAHLEQYTVK